MMLYSHCWRGMKDCTAIECVESIPPETTEEQYANMDYKPESFVCVALIDSGSRDVKQDCYRHCFKCAGSDDMTNNDIQDLTSVVQVMSKAISFDAVRKTAHKKVFTPHQDGGLEEVADV